MFRTLSRTCLLLLGATCATAQPAPTVAASAAGDSLWYETELKAIAALRSAGKPAEAESTAVALLERVEAKDGAESIAAARVLSVYWSALRAAGKSTAPETMQVADRTLRLHEQLFGAESLEYASALMDLGATHYRRGEAAEAIAQTERALALREQHLDPNDRLIGDALSNLGAFRAASGDLAGARVALERALAIAQTRVDEEPSEPFGPLQNLSFVCQLSGDGAAALSYQERSTQLAKNLYGEEHPNYAESLSALASVQAEQGELEQSEVASRSAVAILRAKLGAEHPTTLMATHDLALVLKRLGDYEESRQMYESSLAICERTLGVEHPMTQTNRLSLATLFSTIGDHDSAESLYAQSVSMLEKADRAESLEYAEVLGARAVGRIVAGDHAAAIEQLERAIAIHETVGSGNRAFVLALNNLAEARRLHGEPLLALAIAQRAVETATSSSDASSPQVGVALSTLGAVQLDLGDVASACATHRRAWRIRSDALGANHPEAASSLYALALALADSGETASAVEFALQAEAIGREHVQVSARALSEREALLHARTRPPGLALALAILARGDVDANAAERVWEALALSRGLVFEEMARRHRLSHSNPDAQTEQLWRELATANRQLAQLLVRGRSAPDAATALAAARRELERCERALATHSVVFEQQQAQTSWRLAAGLTQLPEAAQLLAFARFSDPLLELSQRRLRAQTSRPIVSDATRYVALTRARTLASLRVVELGSAAEIDAAVEQWQAAMRQDKEDAARRAGLALRERIWDPLAAVTGEAKLLLIVPDGELHRVDFAALPVGASGYQVESGPTLHHLSSERDLIAPGTKLSGGLLALADPDYDAQTDQAPAPGLDIAAADLLRGRRECAELSQVKWKRLPETRRELRQVLELWPQDAIELVGAAATESNLEQRLAGRRVLHIATHGFYLGSQCEPSANTRGMGGYVAGEVTDAPAAKATVQRDENPLLLSGVVLAGANRHAAQADARDGILTAEEITSFDLSQVECAVLSACETGLGEVRAGEGVFGLRRAFRIAGARTVVTSLWPVQDRATREWMQELYAARWQRGLSIAEAVRQAAREQLERRRAKSESTHPRNWSGFIAVGDWR